MIRRIESAIGARRAAQRPHHLGQPRIRADCTSFGCADENDFTYFGRALFKESLPQAANLSDAFAKAQALVQEWEAKPPSAVEESAPDAAKNVAAAGVETSEAATAKAAVADKVEHSEPQMAVQPAFQKEVDAWFAGQGKAAVR